MRQSPPSQAIHLVLVFLEERNIFKDSVQPSYRAESGGPVNLLFVHLSVSLPPPSLSLSRSLHGRRSPFTRDPFVSSHSFLPIRYRVGRAVDETRAPPELYFYLSPRRHHDSSLRLLGSASSLGGAGDK